MTDGSSGAPATADETEAYNFASNMVMIGLRKIANLPFGPVYIHLAQQIVDECTAQARPLCSAPIPDMLVLGSMGAGGVELVRRNPSQQYANEWAMSALASGFVCCNRHLFQVMTQVWGPVVACAAFAARLGPDTTQWDLAGHD